MQQCTLSPMRYSSCGLATGSDFSRTAWTSVKIAVVAPIPRASVSTAVKVNPGDFLNWRRATLSSFNIRKGVCTLDTSEATAGSLEMRGLLKTQRLEVSANGIGCLQPTTAGG